MHLTLKKSDFAPALSAVTRVVERRNTIAILGNVALTATAGKLTLRATDLDIEAAMTIPAEVADEGEITLPALLLTDIVRKAPDGDIGLDLRPDGGQVAIAAGRSRFTVQALPIEDFPDFTAGNLPATFLLPAADLAAALAAVNFAISTEETRYYLNGVFVHVAPVDGAERLKFVATDGHRLALWHCAPPADMPALPPLLIPRKTVSEIARACGDTGSVRVSASDSKIRVEVGGLTLTSKLIDGTFPDYGRVIPTPSETHSLVDRAELVAALDRVRTISGGDRGRAVKLTVADAALKLSVVNPEAGEATEEVRADGDLEVVTGFNGAYLTELLGVMRGDTVRIEMDNPGAPARLTAAGAHHGTGDFVAVLMPMRV